MSQAEDLLDSLVAEAVAQSDSAFEEAHIIIGNDRYITVPDELKRLAVQFDHNIETVTFDCPRYWDEHDMSKMTVYINYLRANGENGFYRADNVRVNDDDNSIMHFEWTVSGNVTETAGKLTFLVCVRNTDDDGNEVNHWNSELYTECYISEGLECDGEALKELYPDIIAQWYKEVVEVTDYGKSVADDLVARRESGEFDGITFTPSVSEDGDISWTNNGDLENPETVNIKGPQGVSPTIEVEDIQGGHRITITDANGTKSIDVFDTIVDDTEAVAKMLNDFVYVGSTEPSFTPVLWFDTSENATEEYGVLLLNEDSPSAEIIANISDTDYEVTNASDGGTNDTGVRIAYIE